MDDNYMPMAQSEISFNGGGGGGGGEMALSVLGNHIAPEQKPRVPTMSERDLTRKPNSCFTRNRAFFN